MKKVKEMIENKEGIMKLFCLLFVVNYVLKVILEGTLYFNIELLIFVCLAGMAFIKDKELSEYFRKSFLVVSVVLAIIGVVNCLQLLVDEFGMSGFLEQFLTALLPVVVFGYVMITVSFDKKKKVNKDVKVYNYLSLFVIIVYFINFLFAISNLYFGEFVFLLVYVLLELCINLLIMRYAYKS